MVRFAGTSTSQATGIETQPEFFSIEFAALDYFDPDNIYYAYKLDGFDKEWIFSGNQRIANYTNLSPGKYLSG
jgi:hypothetical protein